MGARGIYGGSAAQLPEMDRAARPQGRPVRRGTAAGSLLANVSRFEARHAEALMLHEKEALETFEDVENALVSYGREKTR